MIEVEVDGVTIRAGRGADANTIPAIVQALKEPRGSGEGCGALHSRFRLSPLAQWEIVSGYWYCEVV
jgi:hypothetical protein